MSEQNILVPRTLYRKVKEFHEQNSSSSLELAGIVEDVQHENLLPTLRSYQARAVRWMLAMEREKHTIRIPQDNDTEVRLGKGGILADEMGLGKTVEVLACILAHPYTEAESKRKEYIEELKAALNKDYNMIIVSNSSAVKTENADEDVSIKEEPTEGKKEVQSPSTKEERAEEVEVDTAAEPVKRKRKRNEVLYCEDIEELIHDELTIADKKNKKRKVGRDNKRNHGSGITTTPLLPNDITCNGIKTLSPVRTVQSNLEKQTDKERLVENTYDDEEEEEEEEDEDDPDFTIGQPKKKNEDSSYFYTPTRSTRKRRGKKNDYEEDPSYTYDGVEEIAVGSRKRNSRGKQRKCAVKNNAAENSVIDEVSTPKKKQPSQMKIMLNNWYEELLYQTTPAYIQNKKRLLKTEMEVKCCCFDTVNIDESKRIQCPICKNLQHSECVGVEKRYYSPKDPYICFQCWPKQKLVPSGGTFIVSPASISSQWVDEIKKHIKDGLKILVYDGVRSDGYIQPTTLAQYDIIITNYQVLIKELQFVSQDGETSQGRSLRYAKRFFAPTSPLTCINWWRLCLDEAQMVESVTNKMAEMVSTISAVNRWAICGTPIQKSVDDLYGLVAFLKIEPYNLYRNWNRLLDNPDALLAFVSRVLWRTNKEDVLSELDVPPQQFVPHWLNFSPVESHFYQRQHQDCSKLFMEKIVRFPSTDIPLDSVDRRAVSKLMAPLLRLRQACVHPQLVRGQFIALKKTMTMDELLNQMVSKAIVESEEALRLVISSLNGIAAICVILGDLVEAVDNYRQVLHLSQEYDGKLKVDSLQKIHTMHNLAEILESHPVGVPPTLRDDTLRDDAISLEKVYLEKRKGDMESTKTSLASLASSCQNQLGKNKLSDFDWWISILHWMPEPKNFISSLRFNFENKGPGMSLLSKVHSTYALIEELWRWLEHVEVSRQKIVTKLEQLENLPLDVLAASALECHLRPSKKPGHRVKPSKRCMICSCELSLKEYESQLFSITNKKEDLNSSQLDQSMTELSRGDSEEFDGVQGSSSSGSKEENRDVAQLKDYNVYETYNTGTWKPCQQEQVLRMIVQSANRKQCEPSWIEESNRHFRILNTLRKEFRLLRLHWVELSDHVAARDELSMAKFRLRLPYPDEKIDFSKKNNDKKDEIYIIAPHQVETELARLNGQKVIAESDLKKKMGILLYLKNLQKNGDKQNEPCPICRNQLDEKWSVLRCGHCFCFDCIPVLLNTCGGQFLVCPVCREKTGSGDVSYIEGKSNPVVDKVRGSHTTKVHAIVGELIRLRDEDANVKVLVFSAWNRVLDVLSEALTMNEISFCHLKTDIKKRNSTLKQFKTQEGITALLMNVYQGAKGLNLIEATHVFLIEPLLNPADELQAIGRVHRIGQTRETFVHRFIVKATIEEKMLSAIEMSGTENWSKKKLTLQQLVDLFSPIEK